MSENEVDFYDTSYLGDGDNESPAPPGTQQPADDSNPSDEGDPPQRWLDDGNPSDEGQGDVSPTHAWLDELPSGTVSDADRPVFESFAERMGEHASPEMLQQAAEWYAEQAEQQDAAQAEADDSAMAETAEFMKDYWGADYDAHVTRLQTLVDSSPIPDELHSTRLPDGSLLFNNRDVLAWLGELLSEAGAGAQVSHSLSETERESLEAERLEIEEIMRTNRAAYNKDEGMQARYRQILEGAAVPRKTRRENAGDPRQEREQLEQLMRDPSSKYWRGPRSANLQKRYRELVSRFSN